MRYAVVRARSQKEVEAYLPDNYRVVHTSSSMPDGRANFVIEGEDSMGWTLDNYVIPRLASGNLFAREHPDLLTAREFAAGSMN